jgi:ankyrin repeat protein
MRRPSSNCVQRSIGTKGAGTENPVPQQFEPIFFLQKKVDPMHMTYCIVAFMLVALTCLTAISQTAMPNPIPPLVEAIRTNSAGTIEQIVRENPRLLQIPLDEDQHHALHLAAHHNARQTAEVLLRLGADFYACDRNQQLPLDVPPGQSLNETRMHLRSINRARNEFLSAVHERDHARVRELLATDPSLVNTRDIGDGWSPVMIACHHNDAPLLQLLLGAGCPVNAADFHTGHTALTVATEKGHTECAALLLKAGVDPHQTWRIQYGRLSMDMNALHLAGWKGHGQIVRLLLESKVDPNVRARSYAVFTPLHFAATEGHADIVRLLLDAGADRNALDGRRCITPLQMAEAGKHTAVVEILSANP